MVWLPRKYQNEEQHLALEEKYRPLRRRLALERFEFFSAATGSSGKSAMETPPRELHWAHGCPCWHKRVEKAHRKQKNEKKTNITIFVIVIGDATKEEERDVLPCRACFSYAGENKKEETWVKNIPFRVYQRPPLIGKEETGRVQEIAHSKGWAAVGEFRPSFSSSFLFELSRPTTVRTHREGRR